jgi:hypothetical protein
VSGVVLRMRAELRVRWRAWLGLGLAIGIGCGAVVALAAAARRTDGAYARYLAATGAADAYVDEGIAFGDYRPAVARLAHAPQIVHGERTFILALVSRSRSGRPIFPSGPDHIQYQVPADDRRANALDRPLLLRGRLPDPERPDEALVDRRALATLGVGLGDRFAVRLLRRSFIREHFNRVRMSEDPRSRAAAAYGPLATARIVGVQAQAKADADGGYVNFTPAFRRAHDGAGIGAWSEELAVRLRGGGAGLPALAAAVHARAAGHPYAIFDPGTSRPLVRRSIDLMVKALTVLTVVGAAAALLLAGQAALRAALVAAQATPTLAALGMSRPQLLALGLSRSAVQAVPAVAATVATAVLLSPLAPVGWARDLEPDRGVQVDAVPLLIGGACVLAAVLVAGALGATLALRAPARAPARRAGATAALARAPLPPAALTGIGMALVRRARGGTVPVRTTLGFAVAAVAVAVVAMTLARSVTHLLDTPRLYGQTWDYAAFNGPDDPASARAAARDPVVRDMVRSFNGPQTGGDRLVGARALADVKGRLDPEVLAGRAPHAPGEALLGTKTLNALHRGLGDTVTVRAGRRAVRLRVVGRGVLPTDKWTELGQGIVLRLSDLRRISPETVATGLLIRFAPGADRDAARARMDRIFDGSEAVRPQEVSDLDRVRGAPSTIAAVFVIAAAAALAHLLLATVRRRRRDLAILKTLGFTRGQVVASVAWQATTVATVGALVGVPLGIALGRFSWNLIARDLGVAADPATPLALALAVIPAAVLLANAVALVPARRAARTPPAVVLRAE